MTLSLILPCFNEEENIASTVRDSLKLFEHVDGEIVVVDDGSTDATRDIVRDYPIRIIGHAKNLGYGAAVRSGCDAAKGDIIAFMDSDGQFHARDILRLLSHISEYPFVAGSRQNRADPIFRIFNARAYETLVRCILNVDVQDINCGLKAFHRSIWPVIRPIHSTGALFNAEVFMRLQHAGFSWIQVSVPHYPRMAGEQTGANIKVILKMFKELWKLRKTTLDGRSDYSFDSSRISDPKNQKETEPLVVHR
jgi:glycosyltransferase involved in cell wall biosynthesis